MNEAPMSLTGPILRAVIHSHVTVSLHIRDGWQPSLRLSYFGGVDSTFAGVYGNVFLVRSPSDRFLIGSVLLKFLSVVFGEDR